MRSLWFLLLLAYIGCTPAVSALRCYQCEDCDENTQLSDMEVCNGPLMSGNGQGTPAISSPSPSPSSSSSSSPSPAPSPSPAASPSPSDVSEEEEDYESEESATIGIMPAGNGVPGTGAGNGGEAAAATGGEAGEIVSEEEEEEDEDEDEERRKRRSIARQVDLDMPIDFCYTVRLKLNESMITKRGCTTARMSNQTGGCDGLFDNWTVAGCQLCQDDGCNQPINQESSSRNLGQSWTLLALTLMAFMI